MFGNGKESFFLVSMGYYELLTVTMGDWRMSEGRSSKFEGKKMGAKIWNGKNIGSDEVDSFGSGAIEGNVAEVADTKNPEGKAGCSREF